MIKRLLLSLLLAAFVVPYCQGAQLSDKAVRSQAVQKKFHEIDLLIQLVPLALTTDQIKDVLGPLEKNRAKMKAVLDAEDDAILKFESKADEAVQKAVEQGVWPSHDLQVEIYKVTGALFIKHQLAYAEVMDSMYTVLKGTLNSGQMKAMAGSFDPKLVDPTKKKEDITDESKQRYFIDHVILDPMCYDLLVKLAAKK